MRQTLTTTLEQEEEKNRQLKQECSKLRETQASLEDEKMILEQKITILEEKSLAAERQTIAVQGELENFKKERIRAMEAELERILESKAEELRSQREAQEISMKSLQALFNSERKTLESRLSEERERLQVEHQSQVEELRNRLQGNIADLNEEIEELRALLAKERSNIAELQQIGERESQALKMKLETEMKRLIETRSQMERELGEQQAKYKTYVENLEVEASDLRAKVESSKLEINQKSLEIFSLTQALEQSKSGLARAGADKERATAELAQHLADAKQKLESVSKEKASLLEEFATVKMQLTKDLALSNQRLAFLEKRNEELIQSNEERETAIEAARLRERSGVEANFATQLKALTEEAGLWENRYEEKKKAMKDLEVSFVQRISDIEKTKVVLIEKVNILEAKKEELEIKMKADAESFAIENRKLREGHLTDRKNVVSDLESHRREKYELEIALAESNARYDKDKAILEGKIAFLEQQNRKLRTDLNERQIDFESLFQKFHQYRQVDREETSNSHSAQIIALETKYNSQIQEIREQNKLYLD